MDKDIMNFIEKIEMLHLELAKIKEVQKNLKRIETLRYYKMRLLEKKFFRLKDKGSYLGFEIEKLLQTKFWQEVVRDQNKINS
jgi:hypothetical protein